MSYITVKIENNRFKNPIAKLKRKNLDKYRGSFVKREPNSLDDYCDNFFITKWQDNCCSFDVTDVQVNDFLKFTFYISDKLKLRIYTCIEYVRVHSITDKEICFARYEDESSWEYHQDEEYS